MISCPEIKPVISECFWSNLPMEPCLVGNSSPKPHPSTILPGVASLHLLPWAKSFASHTPSRPREKLVSEKLEPNRWHNYMTIVAIVVYNLFYKYEIRPLLARWVEAVSSQLSSKELPLSGPRMEHCSMIPSSTPFVLLGICKVGIEHGLALLVELTEPRGNLSATCSGVPVVWWSFEHVSINGVQMFHLPIFFGGMFLIHITTLNNFRTLAKSGWFASTTWLLPLPVRP